MWFNDAKDEVTHVWSTNESANQIAFVNNKAGRQNLTQIKPMTRYVVALMRCIKVSIGLIGSNPLLNTRLSVCACMLFSPCATFGMRAYICVCVYV